MKAKRTDPWIPIGHPDFVWTSGADVQKTWRKYGWKPVFGNSPKVEEPQHISKVLKLWKQS